MSTDIDDCIAVIKDCIEAIDWLNNAFCGDERWAGVPVHDNSIAVKDNAVALLERIGV